MNIILASTSPYRKKLLEKLGIKFNCIKPDIDEENSKRKLELQNLSPIGLAEALSYEKGLSVSSRNKESLVISGDQLVSFEEKILGKPLTLDKAIEQLSLINNHTHLLITAITILTGEKVLKYNNVTKLKMKNLSKEEISNYVIKDHPLDCAGSYKIEQSGVALFESIDTDDFTAIQGIPLIWLSNRLKEFGYEFFKN